MQSCHPSEDTKGFIKYNVRKQALRLLNRTPLEVFKKISQILRHPNKFIQAVLFQTNFPHPYSDLTFRQILCHHYLDQRANKTISSNVFRIHTFLFRSYSFPIETITTFMHTLSQFPPKPNPIPDQNGHQTKKAHKPYPLWRHKSIWLVCNGVTPPPPPPPAGYRPHILHVSKSFDT